MSQNIEEDFHRNNSFSQYILYDHAPAQEPLPRVYTFGRHFIGHYNYIHELTLSVLCLGVEKKTFEEIMHFQYIVYMAKTLHKNLCPGGHDI